MEENRKEKVSFNDKKENTKGKDDRLENFQMVPGVGQVAHGYRREFSDSLLLFFFAK